MPKASGSLPAEGAKTTTETRGRRGSTSPASNRLTGAPTGGRRAPGSRTPGSGFRSPAGSDRRGSVSSDGGGHRRSSGSSGAAQTHHQREASRDKSGTRKKKQSSDREEKVAPLVGSPSAGVLSLKSTASEENLQSREENLYKFPKQEQQEEAGHSSVSQGDSNESEPPKQTSGPKETDSVTPPEDTEQSEPSRVDKPAMQTNISEPTERHELPPPLTPNVSAEFPNSEEHSESSTPTDISKVVQVLAAEYPKTEEQLESLTLRENLEGPAALPTESLKTEQHSKSSILRDNLEMVESLEPLIYSEVSSRHDSSDDISLEGAKTSSEPTNIESTALSEIHDNNATTRETTYMTEQLVVERISEVIEGISRNDTTLKITPPDTAGPQEISEFLMEGATETGNVDSEECVDPKSLEKSDSLPAKPHDPEISPNDYLEQ